MRFASRSCAMTTPRILVIDDEVDIRTILTLTLRRAGFQVLTAIDGLEAIDKIAGDVPDLIVLDVMMPRMDGFETLRRIREQAEAASVPVLMLTAKAQVTDKMAGFERGADDYVAKPFEPGEVVARIRSLLKRTEHARLTRPLLSVLGDWSSAEGLAQFGRDLEAARDIQSRLIPTVPPRLAGLTAGAVLRSSMVVGGDFFDVVPMGDHLIGIAVGDVSGKGISAALLMVMVRTLLREIASGATAPADVLARLNHSLCRDMPPAMFVTIALAVIDPAREGYLRVANGGHPRPLLVRAEAMPVEVEVDGLIVGAFPDARFDQIDVSLARGDALVIFSDGVMEARDADGRRPGLAGLVEVIERHRGRDARGLADAIGEDALRRGDGGMRDDVTVFVLMRP
jgi:sigma-B regulation protein RsbU (phosphoserine phosphatase)